MQLYGKRSLLILDLNFSIFTRYTATYLERRRDAFAFSNDANLKQKRNVIDLIIRTSFRVSMDGVYSAIKHYQNDKSHP